MSDNPEPTPNDGDGSDPSGGQSGGTPNAGAGGSTAMQRVMAHMSGNKIEAALWLTRLFTVASTFNYFLPIFGGNPQSSYQRALIASAASSALRLHQRMPNFQFNREYFGRLFLEDSAHYLFYSLIFVSNAAVTMVLIPVFLFALLHAQSYTTQLLNQIGPDSIMILRNLLGKLATNQVSILRFIACNEIFLMPAIILMMFTGHGSLLLPFVYYRFLTLRYGSRRNPYCKQLFYELRVTTEQLVARPQCPEFVRNMSFKVIGFVNRLAPQVPAQ